MLELRVFFCVLTPALSDILRAESQLIKAVLTRALELMDHLESEGESASEGVRG